MKNRCIKTAYLYSILPEGKNEIILRWYEVKYNVTHTWFAI